MKKRIVIGGLGFLLIISVLTGFFLLQNPFAQAQGTRSTARQADGKPTTTMTHCSTVKQHTQQGQGTTQCAGQIQIDIKGRGKLPGKTPTVLPHTPTATPTATSGGDGVLTPVPTLQPTQTVPVSTPVASSGSSGAGNGGGSTAMEIQLVQKLFNQINSDRAAQGLPAYTWNDTLAKGAYLHSVRMTQSDCGLSHQCPGEPAPCQRVTNEGVQWTACGENAGYTSPYPDAWSAVQKNIEGGMLAEQPPNDGHRKNLLSTSFHQVGVGVAIDANGVVWVTEDFTN